MGFIFFLYILFSWIDEEENYLLNEIASLDVEFMKYHFTEFNYNWSKWKLGQTRGLFYKQKKSNKRERQGRTSSWYGVTVNSRFGNAEWCEIKTHRSI